MTTILRGSDNFDTAFEYGFKTLTHSSNMADVAEAWNPVADDSLPQYVAVGSRYVFDSPYGDVPVRVKAYVRSVSEGLTEWFDARWFYNADVDKSYGTHADTLGLSSVVIQTGANFTLPSGTGSGNASGLPGSKTPQTYKSWYWWRNYEHKIN